LPFWLDDLRRNRRRSIDLDQRWCELEELHFRQRLASDSVEGVAVSGSTIYAATEGGLSILTGALK